MIKQEWRLIILVEVRISTSILALRGNRDSDSAAPKCQQPQKILEAFMFFPAALVAKLKFERQDRVLDFRFWWTAK